MSTADKFTDILVLQLGVSGKIITPESHLQRDLGADSLDEVEVVMAVEEEFDIEIPDEDAERLHTVAEWLKYLDERGVKSAD